MDVAHSYEFTRSMLIAGITFLGINVIAGNQSFGLEFFLFGHNNCKFGLCFDLKFIKWLDNDNGSIIEDWRLLCVMPF